MPPSGYLSAGGVEACVQYILASFPSFTQRIVLPETSVDGKTIRAIKIAKGSGDQRRGILFIGGVHARELVNPDLLVTFALRLCQAYDAGTGLTYGPKIYAASTVKAKVTSRSGLTSSLSWPSDISSPFPRQANSSSDASANTIAMCSQSPRNGAMMSAFQSKAF